MLNGSRDSKYSYIARGSLCILYLIGKAGGVAVESVCVGGLGGWGEGGCMKVKAAALIKSDCHLPALGKMDVDVYTLRTTHTCLQTCSMKILSFVSQSLHCYEFISIMVGDDIETNNIHSRLSKDLCSKR